MKISKVLITTAADNILILFIYLFFFFLYFSEKIMHDISCESFALQMIHIKCQVLFSAKIIKKKSRMSSDTISLSTIRVKQVKSYYCLAR